MNTMLRAPKYFDSYEKLQGDKYPELGDGPLSTEPYISPEYFELEREKIFRKAWFKVGLESMIPKPGDYFVKDVPILKSSIIIARGTDGVVRGFHNTCTHRGNELVPKCAKGNQGGFICKFHGWTFDSQGKLQGVPDKDRFAKFDQSTRGLTPVAVECWKGLIFMNANPMPDQTLLHYLGTLARDADPYPFDRLTPVGGWTTEVQANWKVLVDAFQEGYHVLTVHERIAPTSLRCTKTGQARSLSIKLHGNHRTLSGGRNPDWVPAPIEARACQLAGTTLLVPEFKAGEGLWPGINLGKAPVEAYAFDMNVIFPTTSIALCHGLMFIYDTYPIAVDRTRFECTVFRAKPSTWAERIGQEFLQVQFREGLREDFYSIEGMQRGLTSGAIKNVLLCDEELAVRHSYHTIDKMVRG
jgi:phenylpropionate dioxygenase-like ring-hydroxylating dioxygenase large terminal subunit